MGPRKSRTSAQRPAQAEVEEEPHQHQQQEPSRPPSAKGGKAPAVKWDDEQLRSFYQAFHKFNTNWVKVSRAVGPPREPGECEALYRQYQTFLSLPCQPQLEQAFLAMVSDVYNNQKEGGGSGSDAVSEGGEAPAHEQHDSVAVSDGQPAAVQRGRRTARASRPHKPSRSHHSGMGEDAAAGAAAATLARSRPAPTTPISKLTPNQLTPLSASKYKDGRMLSPRAHMLTIPDVGSGSRKKRSRKLFSEEEGADPKYRAGSYMDRWKAAAGDDAHDDVGEGVDALLSLASMAHGASDSDGTEPGVGVRAGGADGGEGRGTRRDTRFAATSHKIATPTRDRVGTGGMDESLILNRAGTPGRASGPSEFIISSPGNVVLKPAPRGATHSRGGRVLKAAERVRLANANLQPYGGTADADYAEDEDTHPAGATKHVKRVPARRRSRPQIIADAMHAASTAEAMEAADGAEHADGLLTGGDGVGVGGIAGIAGGGVWKAVKAVSAHEPPRSAKLLGAKRKSETSARGRNVKSKGGRQPAPLTQEELAQQRQALFAATDSMAIAAEYNARVAAGRQGGGRASKVMQRLHRRKPRPERFLAMASPLRALFNRSGLTPAAKGGAQAAPTSVYGYLPHAGSRVIKQTPPVGETGELMSSCEVALRHCLGPAGRRWVAAEFHYSALDRPWFMRNELHEFMAHLGIGHVSKLTRGEWGMLRSAFGRPRRLSLNFLKQERARLEMYRSEVRRKYDEAVVSVEVPPDVPRPLRVGQEVVARHPATRQLHDGVILTVKGAHYRVQFTRSELMTELVPDIDLMPVDPWDNLPAAMGGPLPPTLNGRPNAAAPGSTHVRKRTNVLPRQGPPTGRVGQPRPADLVARPDDLALLRELSSLLDRKERCVQRLREMNNQAERAKQQGGAAAAAAQSAEGFQQQYASVVTQLQELNTALQAALQAVQSRPHLTAATDTVMQQHSMAATAAVFNHDAARAQAPGGPLSTAGAVATAVAAAAARAGTSAGVLGGGPGAETAAAAVVPTITAAGVVDGAMAEARLVVCKYRHIADAAVATAAASAEAAKAAEQQQRADEDSMLAVLSTPAKPPKPSDAKEDKQAEQPAVQQQRAEAPPAEAATAPSAATASGWAAGSPPAPAGVAATAREDAAATAGPVDGATDASPSVQVQVGLDGDTAAALATATASSAAPAAGAPVAGEGTNPKHESWLTDVITGCVGMLFTVQKCTSGQVPGVVVEDALDLALNSLKPQAQGNNRVYQEIAESVRILKAQLGQGQCMVA